MTSTPTKELLEYKYCRLCGNVCVKAGERLLRLCYACAIKAEGRSETRQRRPGYGFRHD